MTTSPDSCRTQRSGSDGAFLRRALLVMLLVATGLLLWQLRPVVVLVFGAIVLAVGLRIPMIFLEQRFGLSSPWGLALVLLTTLLGLTLGFWLAGDRLASQFSDLREQLPRALEEARRWLDSHPMGERIANAIRDIEPNEGWLPQIGGMAGLTLSALGSAGLLIVMAIFLAADPRTYLRGAVRLAPPGFRPRLSKALAATGERLSLWLVGQSISMTFVGISTAVGLWLLGMPLALSLGFIAGLLAFVPYFGPIASGALAVALAFTEGPLMALWVALLLLAIQQVEGNLLMPFVQRWATSLPPVLALVAVMAFGILLGMPGIIFATPLMVALMTLVQHLYLEGVLEA